MQSVTRRSALALGVGAACMAGTATAQGAPFVRSDIGGLKRVLVHSIAETDEIVDALGEDLLPYAETDQIAAVRQQAGLMTLLRKNGVEVVEVAEALEAAIAATRASGVFAAYVKAAFPRLGADPANVTAAMLLSRDAALRYRLGADGAYRHVTDDASSTMWTRDSAFMAPQGIVICCAASHRRRRENMLMRFIYAHSPLLSRYPIAFDAVQEGIVIEGGDAMVVDDRTLFLGVGNRTDPRAAPILAQRLNMDVLAVQTLKRDFVRPRLPGMPPAPFADLRYLFLHLDTYFTHVGPRHALTAPFMLEREFEETNPLARYIRGARAETLMPEEDAAGALDMLKEFGRVTLYRRGSGRADDLGGEIKLVDYLRRQRYRFTFTGGPPPGGDADQFRHFMNVVYPEHRRQATNVVQAAPGRVLAYAGSPATKAALEGDGIAVDTFEARELWAWHGGPHCLTQPLER